MDALHGLTVAFNIAAGEKKRAEEEYIAMLASEQELKDQLDQVRTRRIGAQGAIQAADRMIGQINNQLVELRRFEEMKNRAPVDGQNIT
jgi:hypothetical protein